MPGNVILPYTQRGTARNTYRFGLMTSTLVNNNTVIIQAIRMPIALHAHTDDVTCTYTYMHTHTPLYAYMWSVCTGTCRVGVNSHSMAHNKHFKRLKIDYDPNLQTLGSVPTPTSPTLSVPTSLRRGCVEECPTLRSGGDVSPWHPFTGCTHISRARRHSRYQTWGCGNLS